MLKVVLIQAHNSLVISLLFADYDKHFRWETSIINEHLLGNANAMYTTYAESEHGGFLVPAFFQMQPTIQEVNMSVHVNAMHATWHSIA